MKKEIKLYAVGDIAPNRENPDTIFEKVAPFIREADIAFCQLDSVLSRRGTPLPQARLVAHTDPEVATSMKKAGFDVVSFASNHCMDMGREAFFDTLDALHHEDLVTIGVGENINQARRPAIEEREGTKVAFLGYNSILPQAYWAESDRPGCTPMRAHTLYEQVEHDQPGTPCRTHTFAHREDLQGMIHDIKKAKEKADVVVVSVHWGIHFVPAVLADYQREVAHAAIDAGADLILGHHAHILKGVEVYKGKVIFYSLGNFAIELPPHFKKDVSKSKSFKEIQTLNSDWDVNKALWPIDSYKSITVKCTIDNKRIKNVAFQPTYIDPKTDQPKMLNAEDPQFNEVVEYMQEITNTAKLNAGFFVQGDEVLVKGDEVDESIKKVGGTFSND
ncbi:CapA family protein [Halalkalibacter krulwichiae]|uniref:Capsule biosynthesis protein CapA n=1 Tax=Halalkalibacter krulwichiae TaxID=199441 RepID=A0A1X9MBA7_9BACI|nr:CapA family protein [Halalkalibacter krulwichiae]ARK29924.1 Capsule biosynthesis protein CapA [Halalkalibacter krulwichiae]